MVPPSGRSKSGYRTYDNVAINKLIFVKRARSFDFTIDACKELLGLYEAENRTSADVKKIAKHHLGEIKRKEAERQRAQIRVMEGSRMRMR